MKLDHLGIAVSNIEEYYRKCLSVISPKSRLSKIFTDESQKSRIAFVIDVNGPKLELVEALGEGSPTYLRSQSGKGGLYHLCYSTNDLDSQVVLLERAGFLMLGKPQPAVAFGGKRVIFFYTPFRELIEIVEDNENK